MPEGASFGIKRPAFTRGSGGGASPHIQLHPCKPAKSLCLKGYLLGAKALRLRGSAGGIREQKMCIFGEIKRIGVGAGGAFLVL